MSASEFIEIEHDGEGAAVVRSTLSSGGPAGDESLTDLGAHPPDNPAYNAAIDGLESLILAQACAGIDITTDQYAQAVRVAVEAIANHMQ